MDPEFHSAQPSAMPAGMPTTQPMSTATPAWKAMAETATAG
jgi:hypothetical protein